jgi:hypothetical protein
MVVQKELYDGITNCIYCVAGVVKFMSCLSVGPEITPTTEQFQHVKLAYFMLNITFCSGYRLFYI